MVGRCEDVNADRHCTHVVYGTVSARLETVLSNVGSPVAERFPLSAVTEQIHPHGLDHRSGDRNLLASCEYRIPPCGPSVLGEIGDAERSNGVKRQ